MKRLSTLNGWQRLWFVGTCLALVGFGMIYPFTSVYRTSRYEWNYERALQADIQSPKCRDYLVLPLSQLQMPTDPDAGACWHVFTARTNDPDVRPYTMAAYEQRQSKYRLEQLQIGVTVYIGLVLAASALVYFLGFLVAWIRRGFRQAT